MYKRFDTYKAAKDFLEKFNEGKQGSFAKFTSWPSSIQYSPWVIYHPVV